MKKPPASFKEAYATLQAHAQTLREQDEPNIDDLLAMVQESVAAYAVCRKRIDAVEKALEETFRSVEGEASPAAAGAEGASQGGRGRGTSVPEDGEPLDDGDIPF